MEKTVNACIHLRHRPWSVSGRTNYYSGKTVHHGFRQSVGVPRWTRTHANPEQKRTVCPIETPVISTVTNRAAAASASGDFLLLASLASADDALASCLLLANVFICCKLLPDVAALLFFTVGGQTRRVDACMWRYSTSTSLSFCESMVIGLLLIISDSRQRGNVAINDGLKPLPPGHIHYFPMSPR